MSARILHTDCALYRGSLPCAPHKASGQLCEGCPSYAPMRGRILIVKLGAMGDVLRTTALLPDIRARHPGAQVIWLTRAESIELIAQNPLVDRVLPTERAAELLAGTFDAVYALDNDPEGLAYAKTPRARAYYGFVAGDFGTCVGVAPGGDPTLFELGVWDDLKRSNRRSYLALLGAAAGIPYSGGLPHIVLDAREVQHAATLLRGIPHPRVGINADASTRWERKQWNFEYVSELAGMAVRDGYGVVLFGGAEVFARNKALASRFAGRAAAFESAGAVLRLNAGIAQCDVLLTGDTLAMHIAWGLGIRIVALFGPTSLPEIDLAPADRKLAATELACLGCYLKTCSVDPHCMDRLVPQDVYRSVRALLPHASA